MPLTSAFTVAGHHELSSRPSHGEKFFRAIANSYGGQFSTEQGTRSGALCYATAMMMARCKYTFDRVLNQMDPALAVETLPVWEQKLAITPMFAATIPGRESDAEAVYNRDRIGTRQAIISALKDEIGDDFIAYRTLTHSESLPNLSDPANGPANWTPPSVPQKIVRLNDFVARVLVPLSVRYQRVSGDSLDVGDSLVISTNNIGLAEHVTVTALAADRYNSYFTATFTKAHDIGDVGTTGPFPYWLSTQTLAIIVVTQSAAESADSRRRINSVMRQLARGVATWEIAPAGDATHTAAFTPGDAVLGRPGYALTGPALTF